MKVLTVYLYDGQVLSLDVDESFTAHDFLKTLHDTEGYFLIENSKEEAIAFLVDAVQQFSLKITI